ncbi:MAG: TRAP transporter small permease subunit [Pseudomonadota bacterium]
MSDQEQNSRGGGAVSVLAFGVILLMLAVVLQVVCSFFDVNPLVSFAEPWPVLGRAITLNSLLDLQWHLLVIVGLLPAGLVWLRGGHVRVDFLYEGRSDRWRARVDLVGNLLFAAPFLVLILPASWDFAMRARASGEGSRNGGLEDLWLIKAVLPLGLALLSLALIIETIGLLRRAR